MIEKKDLSALKSLIVKNIEHSGNAHCNLLWDRLFINNKGNVYVCCLLKPGIIGNIYREDLSRIWKGSVRLNLFRLMSIRGCLNYFCQQRCIFMSELLEDNSTREVFLEYPRRLDILFGESCNLECIMCGQDHRGKTALDINILKKNVGWSRLEEITLQGGEILVMKDGREFYLWLTQKMNKKVDLITNGMFINDEWADYMTKGSNWIQISVNAATEKTHELVNKHSKFKTVINNIKRLVRSKSKNNSEVKIVYKYTIVKENLHEITKAIDFAESLGCDKICYGYDNPVPAVLTVNNKLKSGIKNEISNKLDNKNLRIHLNRDVLEFLGLFEPNNFAHPKK